MKRLSGTVTLFALVLTTGALTAAEPDNFFFKKNERVMFLGDSITEQYQYSSYIELYLTTRFPKADMFFMNAGIGGDTANGGAGRFQKHVLDEKPTVVTIDFGMNDGGYGKFNEGSAKNFIAKTEVMLKMAKEANVRVALISPNAVDFRKPGREVYIETQKQFYAPLKDLAEKYQVPFVDQYAVTRAAMERMAKNDDAKANPFPDAVHTNGQGGLLMAHTILVGLKAPALVSDVEIDAASGKATPKACKVDKVDANASALAFDRTDEALPIPVQKDWLPILPYVNDLKDFNYYGLKVTGLKEGKYDLTIDGKAVATYTDKELTAGVNLGNLGAGPIFDQGDKVFKAINAKNQIVHGRFRGVILAQVPDWLADVAAERRPKELATRMEKITTAQADVYKQAQPTTHRFELKAAK